ncbi:DUF3368 domain-containing protein [Thermococcus barophilus]|uniref:Nucleic acid-binding protein n=1 Tax=Thermococcus barophilus (strain DSM 11836 / MP) TaxID=391623 RepID=F0LLU2_THEBM|nr:DUF3368 domain-containing protein [Thermococcus barophilus]ADT85041.1 nucleic acid-binding protein [Thermococcus barophilus MP]
MIVVSDSGPLIALAKIGKLNVLMELFGQITIPRAVWIEVVERGKGKPGSDEVKNANWIKVIEVEDKLSVEILRKEIEIGEAEAIVLAKELNANLIILDEKIPRIIAKSLGLTVVGSLAILFIAKKRGIIGEDLDLLINELRTKGVRFSDKVIEELRRMCGSA